jgi:hypothetical protein
VEIAHRYVTEIDVDQDFRACHRDRHGALPIEGNFDGTHCDAIRVVRGQRVGGDPAQSGGDPTVGGVEPQGRRGPGKDIDGDHDVWIA